LCKTLRALRAFEWKPGLSHLRADCLVTDISWK